jgi:hypothetical protein
LTRGKKCEEGKKSFQLYRTNSESLKKQHEELNR